MEIQLSDEIRDIFNIVWAIIPPTIQTDLQNRVTIVKVVDSLDNFRAQFDNGYERVNEGDAEAWCCPNADFTLVKIFLSDKKLQVNKEKQDTKAHIIYLLLHEFGHAIETMDYAGLNVASRDIGESELFACKKVLEWGKNSEDSSVLEAMKEAETCKKYYEWAIRCENKPL